MEMKEYCGLLLDGVENFDVFKTYSNIQNAEFTLNVSGLDSDSLSELNNTLNTLKNRLNEVRGNVSDEQLEKYFSNVLEFKLLGHGLINCEKLLQECKEGTKKFVKLTTKLDQIKSDMEKLINEIKAIQEVC